MTTTHHSSDRRVTVWVQRFADRPHLVLQWHDPDTGKRKSKSTRTADPREADRLRADLEYELSHGTHQEPSKVPWVEFRALFEREFLSARRPDTRDSYQETFDAFERLAAPPLLRAVSERTLSGFAAALRARGNRPSTIHLRLAHLKAALRWAVEQKFLPDAPKPPKVEVPRSTPQPVAAEAFERLLDAAGADRNMRAFLLCGWRAGLRLGEAHRLEWEPTRHAPHLELDHDRIYLPGDFCKGKRDAWVPLDPELKVALLALPRTGRRVFSFVGRGKDLKTSSVTYRVIRLAKKAGVRMTMKTLRKGFGCRYAGQVPAQVLQKLMRHSSIQLTMDYYANVDDAVMEAILGPRNVSRNTAPAGGAKIPG
jgi:integrase